MDFSEDYLNRMVDVSKTAAEFMQKAKPKNKSIFRKRYRIVTDNYAGYEVQVKLWFWPFWLQLWGCNTNISIRQALETIEMERKESHKKVVVYED